MHKEEGDDSTSMLSDLSLVESEDPSARDADLERAVAAIIEAVGDDPAREGLLETPRRVAKAWREATSGYLADARSVIGAAVFREQLLGSPGRGGLLVVRDIAFSSTWEHDLQPFHGKCHIAYLPRDGLVLGLSKLARLAKLYSRRLTTQQRLAADVGHSLEAAVDPQGVAVLVEATRLEGEEPAAEWAVYCSGTFSAPSSLEDLCSLLTLPSLSVEKGLAGPAPLSGAAGLPSPLRQVLVRNGACGRSACVQVCALSDEEEGEGTAWPGSTSEPSSDATTRQCRLEEAVTSLLGCLGEEVCRQGLLGSAGRYARHLLRTTWGARAPPPSPVPLLPGAGWQQGVQGACRAAAFPFNSYCEHHLLPFRGQVQVAYEAAVPLCPDSLREVLQAISARLQIQERLTRQFADAVQGAPGVSGVVVVCRAVHLCMVARGVEQHGSTTLTTASAGLCLTDGGRHRRLLNMAHAQLQGLRLPDSPRPDDLLASKTDAYTVYLRLRMADRAHTVHFSQDVNCYYFVAARLLGQGQGDSEAIVPMSSSCTALTPSRLLRLTGAVTTGVPYVVLALVAGDGTTSFCRLYKGLQPPVGTETAE